MSSNSGCSNREYFHAKGGCGISVGHTKYTNASLLRVLGVYGLEKNRERQCGNGPHTSVSMAINNLEIRSLFTKLSLGITLVVRIKQSGSNSYQEKTRSGKRLD